MLLLNESGSWLIHSAVFGAVILLLGGIAARLCREPVYRIRIIHWTFVACLLVPVFQQLDIIPGYSLNLWGDVKEEPLPAVSEIAAVTETPVVLESHPVESIREPLFEPIEAIHSQHQSMEAPVIAEVEEVIEPDLSAVTPETSPYEMLLGGGRLLQITYFAFVGFWFVIWMIGFFRRFQIAKRAKPASDELRDILISIAGPKGKHVRLLVSDHVQTPIMWGTLRPTIVIPSQLAADPNSASLRWALAHEWSHVLQGDFSTQLLASFTKFVCFYQPAYWWLRRQLTLSQDFLADAFAAKQGDSTEDYADFLVSIARKRNQPLLAGTLGISDHGSNLLRRVNMLVQSTRPLLQKNKLLPTLLITLLALLTVGGLSTVRLNARPTENSTAETEKASEEKTDSTAKNKEQKSDDKPADEKITLQYRGKVIAPDGTPVEGAKIYAVYWKRRSVPNSNVEPLAITDKNGVFKFSTSVDDFDTDVNTPFLGFSLIATADGFGFASDTSLLFETSGRVWEMLPEEARAYWTKNYANTKPVLQLVKDNTPITGRVVNANGKPVEGARVRVNWLWYNKKGNLDAWELAAGDEKADFFWLRKHTQEYLNGSQLPSVFPDVLTDAEGHFIFRGIGRERVVQLLLSGTNIETSLIKTRTRKGKKIVLPLNWSHREEKWPKEVYFGTKFTCVTRPSKPVIGQVTDADTGEPVAGVLVSGGTDGSITHSVNNPTGTYSLTLNDGKKNITAVTDNTGRYRLEGLPIGEQEPIYLFPPTGIAYVPVGAKVSTQTEHPQSIQNFKLKQGIWVQGKAVDSRTGKPVLGRVQFRAYSNNPNLTFYKGFLECGIRKLQTDKEGHFRIPVIPGKGIVTFEADDHAKYRRGQGTETITGPVSNPKSRLKGIQTRPSGIILNNIHILQEITTAIGSVPEDISFTLTAKASEEKTDSNVSQIKPQPLPEQKLAPVINLPKPITYTGKVIDYQTGKPIAGATVKVIHSLHPDPATGESRVLQTTSHKSDKDGKYQFTLPAEEVVQSNLFLRLSASHPGYNSRNLGGYNHSLIRRHLANGDKPFFETIRLTAGEAISGLVVQPDGTPAVNTQMIVFSKSSSGDRIPNSAINTFRKIQTDKNGRFRVIVETPGDGMLWIYPKNFSPMAHRIGDHRGDIGTLKLQQGTRLQGRVLDVNGKPIAHVPVNLYRIVGGEYINNLFLMSNSIGNGIRTASKTDKQGWFHANPLPPGTYRVTITNDFQDLTVENSPNEIINIDHTFEPVEVTIQNKKPIAPIEIRAVPHFVVRGRYFNSKGKPVLGHRQYIFGKKDGKPISLSSTQPDREGWFEFKVPKGVQEVQVAFLNIGEGNALRWRTASNAPFSHGEYANLGTLKKDITSLEIIQYTAPTLYIKGVYKDGKQLENFWLITKYKKKSAAFSKIPITAGILSSYKFGDIYFSKQSDGRWRSSGLLPDEKVTITLEKEGFTTEPQVVSLKEGEKRELVFVFKKNEAN